MILNVFKHSKKIITMAKPFLCKIGIHKYGKATFISGALSNVRDWKKSCEKCGKVKTWVQAKRSIDD